MKAGQLLTAAISGMLALTAASCKKDDDKSAETNATRIIGSWRESYTAIDSNGNRQAEPGERTGSSVYRLITFYTNQTYRDSTYFSGTASSTEASYSIDDTHLYMYFPGVPAYRVLQLDGSSLSLYDSTRSPGMIATFSRQ